MIDLHNHILPGVDDGAVDLAESLHIARQFAAEGVTIIAATPHLDPLRGRGPDAATAREMTNNLQQAVWSADIDLTIVPGHELFLTPEAPSLLVNNVALCLGRGRSVLVEVSLTASERPLYLDHTLFRLQLDGFQPIVAHPERYGFVRHDSSSVDELVSRGIAFQLTAPSLLGEYGASTRRLSEELLAKGVYALASSDRHHPGSHRSLKALHQRLADIGGENAADLLLKENPARLLNGDDWTRLDPLPRRQRGSVIGRLFVRSSDDY
ncbi:MAG: tyrosine protein phosphatase [Chloroflexota bacterium]